MRVLQPTKAAALCRRIWPQQRSKPILEAKATGRELEQRQSSYSAHAVTHAEAGIPVRLNVLTQHQPTIHIVTREILERANS